MGVDNELGEAQDLPAQVKGISKTRFLSLFGSEGLDRLEVEVVVKMEVVEVLAMDQQVQHIVTLTTDLEPRLHPVQFRGLEELGSLEGPEQVPDRERGGEGGILLM